MSLTIFYLKDSIFFIATGCGDPHGHPMIEPKIFHRKLNIKKIQFYSKKKWGCELY